MLSAVRRPASVLLRWRRFEAMADQMPPERAARSAEDALSDWTQSGPAAAAGAPAEAVYTPGTMLAGRYRVVAPLGKGGMGEVYRADDTKLGQAVALKFVRGTLSADLLSRLYAEVRIGRQVSHPNVCRLHDVVEVDGQTFLAMEYVDGEDLASLLARIGRLPPDKALDIARDLAAGLAAMHEKGIVHRDLKPANVMIDGRGRARLTDFGLAVALEAPGTYAFAGTPSYMSPEQLAGGAVTPRSDVYSLGLLLFEMLTGRRFFEARTLDELRAQHHEAKAPRLAAIARMVVPAVEHAVLQCLEEDPSARPSSARAVFAMLPGADPLEAAMAAGETPSPEVVAAASKVGDLAPLTAWAALLAVLAGFVAIAALYDHFGLITPTTLPKTPDVLEERALGILMRLGYTSDVVDSASSFDWDRPYLAYRVRQGSWAALHQKGGGAFMPFFLFYYRQSPRKLVAANRDGVVRRDDPPAAVPGMREVVLSPIGRLASFMAVPPQVDASDGPWREPDWTGLLQDAGLDPNALRQATPQWAAPVDSDRKAAWTGTHPDDPAVPIRVEAAGYHGRPVWFAVLPPWSEPDAAAARPRPSSPTPVGDVAIWILALAMPFGGVLLARRNLRLGRGDRKGAFRVALFVFVVYSIARVFRADHVSSFGDELWLLIKLLAYPMFWAAQVWLLYMALEPYARRRWPHVLISWKRVLGGKLRDPLVGREVLLGAAVGLANAVVFLLSLAAQDWLNRMPPALEPYVQGDTLTSLRHVAFRLFVNQFSAVLYGTVFLFMLVLLRVVVRNIWVAAVLWGLLVATPPAWVHGGDPAIQWAGGLVRAATLFFVLTRGGLLALCAALLFMFTVFEAPLTLHLSAWYASRGLVVAAALAAIAVYAFHTSLAGKPLFGRPLIED
jgi:serine/threonine-protein kinase